HADHTARLRLDQLAQLVAVPRLHIEQRQDEERYGALLQLGGQHGVSICGSPICGAIAVPRNAREGLTRGGRDGRTCGWDGRGLWRTKLRGAVAVAGLRAGVSKAVWRPGESHASPSVRIRLCIRRVCAYLPLIHSPDILSRELPMPVNRREFIRTA